MFSDKQRVNELATIYFFKGIKGLGPVKAKEIFENSDSFPDFFYTKTVAFTDPLLNRKFNLYFSL